MVNEVWEAQGSPPAGPLSYEEGQEGGYKQG